MGIFDFDTDEWLEEQRKQRIRNQIRDLNDDIEEYKDAKEKVQDAKKSCTSEKDSWSETVGKLAGKEVKQTGVFEGEMANALENYINEAKEENNTAITKAGELIGGLDGQITKIENKISELESRVTNLRNQLR